MDQKLDRALSPINKKIDHLEEEITGIKGEITGIKAQMADMQGEITGIKGEITGMKAQMAHMQDQITRTNLSLENEVWPAIQVIGEGQELTHKMIKELATKEEVSDLRDEVRILRTVVAQHTREIEELKQAQ